MARTTSNGSTSSSSRKSTSSKTSSGTKTSRTGKSKREGSLEEFFEKELKDIYSAETQLLEEMPEMVRAAYS